MNARRLDVVVYGIINAGKSSLINGLVGREIRPAGPIGGTTVDVADVEWRVVREDGEPDPPPQPSPARGERGEGAREGQSASGESARSDSLPPCGGGLGWGDAGGPNKAESSQYTIRLLDTPGLEEVGDEARAKLATDAARRADLILFVLSEDLTATSRQALVDLHEAGKPIVVALNKVDLLDPYTEYEEVLHAIQSGLAGVIPPENIVPIAAAPLVYQAVAQAGGPMKFVAGRGKPEIRALELRLLEVLAGSAGDLKALADISASVESHVEAREVDRAKLRERAERVADETSAALAVALAVNPVPLLDFLTGPGGLVILVRRVSEVYGERISTDVARGLASELIRGGRAVLWGSLAATIGGGAMKFLPGFGHLAGALTQGASAGYFGHVVGRALVDYLDHGHDWGDGGLVATLDRIAASTDRKAVTRGLVDRIKARLKGQP